jgi:hypothetical protein
MYFCLDKLHICLAINHPLIDQYANQVLADWIHTTGTDGPCQDFEVHFHLELVEQLPPLPAVKPVFVDDSRRWPDGIGDLSVYQQSDSYLLSFHNGGLVQLPAESERSYSIQGYVTSDLLRYGRLKDLLFTSISPFLRRQEYYLAHASAAAKDGALLFVGPPGSGKTTTLLNLLMDGWHYLGNDTLLLQARPDGVYALPTPGGFAIRPESIAWLPALIPFLPPVVPSHKFYIPARKVVDGWAEAAPIKRIYFPTIVEGVENQLTPLSQAMTLVYLMNYSLDRWDTASLPAHISVLEQLSRQAQGFTLAIARQEQIPRLIAR